MMNFKRCERCNKESKSWTMSWFNMDKICPECDKEEKAHPDFQKAKEAVYREEANGNRNYEGIGWYKPRTSMEDK